MAASAQKKSHKMSYSKDRNVYVYGNAVAEKRREQEAYEERRRQRQLKRQERELHKIEDRMHKKFTAFSILLILGVTFICISHIRLGSHVEKHAEHVSEMQNELSEKREENTTKYNLIIDSVNLEEVREKAVNDYGMSNASKNQIVGYDNSDGGYIKQYEDIPEEGILLDGKKSRR